MPCVYRSEDNLCKSGLPYLVGYGDNTQVVSLGDTHLHPLSHLATLLLFLIINRSNASLLSTLGRVTSCCFVLDFCLKVLPITKQIFNVLKANGTGSLSG